MRHPAINKLINPYAGYFSIQTIVADESYSHIFILISAFKRIHHILGGLPLYIDDAKIIIGIAIRGIEYPDFRARTHTNQLGRPDFIIPRRFEVLTWVVFHSLNNVLGGIIAFIKCNESHKMVILR